MHEARIFEVTSLLSEGTQTYGDLPLGNHRDPLDELIFIILTTMTQYGPVDVFDRLKQVFPTWEGLTRPGGEANLREVIAICGLVNQKAPQIVAIAQRLKEDYGRVTLDPLHDMSDAEAERYLLSLPRVGKKVARCVMMYSLGRDVLPVDAHVLRVGKRIGLFELSTSWPRAHERVHEVVPPEHRFALHVGLVSHGRTVCTYRNPKCSECVLMAAELCPGV
jgi:endonuclease III